VTVNNLTARMTSYAFARHRANSSSSAARHTEAMVEHMFWYLLALPGTPRVLLNAGLLEKFEGTLENLRVSRSRQRATTAKDGQTDIYLTYGADTDPAATRTNLILELKINARLTESQFVSYAHELETATGQLVIVCPQAHKSAVIAVAHRYASKMRVVVPGLPHHRVLSFDDLAAAARLESVEYPNEREGWDYLAGFVNSSLAPSLPLPSPASLNNTSAAHFYSASLNSLFEALRDSSGDVKRAQNQVMQLADENGLMNARSKGIEPKALARAVTPKKVGWSVSSSYAKEGYFQGGMTNARRTSHGWRLGIHLNPADITLNDGLVWFSLMDGTTVLEWISAPTIGHRPADDVEANAAREAGIIVWAAIAAVSRHEAFAEFKWAPVALKEDGSSGIKLVAPGREITILFNPAAWSASAEKGPVFIESLNENRARTQPPAVWEQRDVRQLASGEDYLQLIVSTAAEMWDSTRA
jgi:hypothetical protein